MDLVFSDSNLHNNTITSKRVQDTWIVESSELHYNIEEKAPNPIQKRGPQPRYGRE
jgi:hypothetical protein